VGFVENMGKWMPDHRLTMTGIGVAMSGTRGSPSEGMRIELEAVAHDPEGAKTAKRDQKEKKGLFVLSREGEMDGLV
jgi:hypothetical protein